MASMSRMLVFAWALGFPVIAAAAPSELGRILDEFKKPEGKVVLVCAHRGLSGLSTGQWSKTPENSLPAIARSISIGIDIVEIDVRETKDGGLVLMHDATVDRTTDGKGKVADMTLAEIKKLHLRLNTVPNSKDRPISEERVPTLEEVMLLCKGKCMVNIDKAENIIPKCYEVLKKTGTLDQVIFVTSKKADSCRKVLEGLKPAPVYKPTIVHAKNWQTAKPQGWQALKPYVDQIHPMVFELGSCSDEDPIVSAETVALVKKNGARAWINTLWDSISAGHSDDDSLKDPEAGWGWMVKRGANIIQTDESEKLLEYLRSQKLHW
jgi:glycerophosphoryl diester phosphodiesterase